MKTKDRFKFRGMTYGAASAKWVYGSVYENHDGRITIRVRAHDDLPPRWTESLVDPETVGQCTGLKDRAGTLIHEGDIIEEGLITGFTYTHVVVFHERKLMFRRQGATYGYADLFQFEDAERLEIIGNIHQNKELLS